MLHLNHCGTDEQLLKVGDDTEGLRKERDSSARKSACYWRSPTDIGQELLLSERSVITRSQLSSSSPRFPSKSWLVRLLKTSSLIFASRARLSLFEDGNLCAIHANRVNVMPNNIWPNVSMESILKLQSSKLDIM